jgi:sigma-B regulation protein RsbU (phosphoserine phosphatase)
MATAEKILTIEDEPGIRSSIVAYLEDSGFEMLEAADGQSGLEVFRRERPDVVLCDLCLPEIDGLEVLSTITTESPETPVIIVSGVGMLGHVVQALKRGAWDYVTKPIEDMEVLQSAVDRASERAGLIRQNQQYRQYLEALNKRLGQTVQKLQQDEEAGRRIQRQLLPKGRSTFGDYAFSQRLYPSMYLSGDFLDYFVIDHHRIGFYIADVSGHGAASAFVTVMLKTLVDQHRDAYIREGDKIILHPEKLLQRLNEELCRHPFDKYLTMFYGVLDRAQNRLTCSSGGQFPAPLLHNGQGVQNLSCEGLPIGLFNDADYDAQRILLPDVFTLMLVSDGILEILPQPSLAEKRSALRTLIAGNHVDLDTLTAQLGVTRLEGLPDDVTFMLITKRHEHA